MFSFEFKVFLVYTNIIKKKNLKQLYNRKKNCSAMAKAEEVIAYIARNKAISKYKLM
jgi:hypothetical protein